MNNRCNCNRLAPNAIDYPIAINKVLSNVFIIELWYDTTGKRKVGEAACRIKNLLYHCRRLSCGISSDVAGYGFDILHGSRRPFYLVSHLPNCLSASSWVSVP